MGLRSGMRKWKEQSRISMFFIFNHDSPVARNSPELVSIVYFIIIVTTGFAYRLQDVITKRYINAWLSCFWLQCAYSNELFQQGKPKKKLGRLNFQRGSNPTRITVLLKLRNAWAHTVHPESIHSASLFPHFVMLLPDSKMEYIHFFPKNSTHNNP